MRKIALASFVVSFALSGFVQAATINLPGRSIDVNGSGNATINYSNGSSTQVNQNSSANTTVTTPGRTTTSNGNSVQTTTGNFSIKVNDKNVTVANDSDFKNFGQMVVAECASIKNVSTSGSTVEVEYQQPAKFLGFIKSNLKGKITVDENSNVSIKLPWYSFLYSKNTSGLKTKISSDLSTTSGVTNVTVEHNAIAVTVVASEIGAATNSCGAFASQNNLSNSNSNSQNQNPTPAPAQTPTPAPNPTPNPTPSSSNSNSSTTTVASFKGDWNGTYTPNAATDAECKPGGTASFSINSNGGVTGYAVVQGQQVPGTATVDASGNIKGSWHYSGVTSSFSGKLNLTTGKGSGSYQDSFGCFGTFSVSKS